MNGPVHRSASWGLCDDAAGRITRNWSASGRVTDDEERSLWHRSDKITFRPGLHGGTLARYLLLLQSLFTASASARTRATTQKQSAPTSYAREISQQYLTSSRTLCAEWLSVASSRTNDRSIAWPGGDGELKIYYLPVNSNSSYYILLYIVYYYGLARTR